MAISWQPPAASPRRYGCAGPLGSPGVVSARQLVARARLVTAAAPLGLELQIPSDRPTDGTVSALLATGPGEPEHAEDVLRDETTEAFATLEEEMNPNWNLELTRRAVSWKCEEQRQGHLPLLP